MTGNLKLYLPKRKTYMSKNLILLSAVTGMFFGNVARAQEFSTTDYVGSLEGAAQACAEAFPQKAAIFRDSLYRSMKCHLEPEEFVRWRKSLRATPQKESEYQKGYATGLASLAPTTKDKAEQCRSLELLACDPKSPP
jgi:hypothetical protein